MVSGMALATKEFAGLRTLETLARRLQRFFGNQARRVVASYLALVGAQDVIMPPPQPEELLGDDERQALWLVLLPFLYVTIVETAEAAGELVGLAALDDSDPRVSLLLTEIYPRIAGMHRTTLDAIRMTLAEGAARGYVPRQIAYGVPADGYRGLRIVAEVYAGRHLAIARTELANISQLARLERFQEAGVSQVRVSDGEGCGWRYHNDPDKADRTLRTLWSARAYPIAHPNCVRHFMPAR
jgi:hypothetical protein